MLLGLGTVPFEAFTMERTVSKHALDEATAAEYGDEDEETEVVEPAAKKQALSTTPFVPTPSPSPAEQASINTFIYSLQRTSNAQTMLTLIHGWLGMKKDINAAHSDGHTALTSAAAKGHLDLFTYLHAQGANLSVSTNRGWTPLKIAAEYGHIAIAKYILEHTPHDDRRIWQLQSALKVAAANDELPMVEFLLSTDAPYSFKSAGTCETPLIAAAQRGAEAVVTFFLQNGQRANIQFREHEYKDALFKAAEKGYFKIVQLLLAHGALPYLNKLTSQGWTAIMYASREGHTDIVRLLLKHGADPKLGKIRNARDVAKYSEIVRLIDDHNETPLIQRPPSQSQLPPPAPVPAAAPKQPVTQPVVVPATTFRIPVSINETTNAQSLADRLFALAKKNAETADMQLITYLHTKTKATLKELFDKAVADKNDKLLEKLAVFKETLP